MSFKFSFNKNDFLISDAIEGRDVKDLPFGTGTEDIYHIFGYCFTDSELLKNSSISKQQYKYIKENKDTISGIFTAVSRVNGRLEVITDPLVQYNLFYTVRNKNMMLSNSLTLLSQFSDLNKPEYRNLFDRLAYVSPMRGLTVVKDIFILQYDDLQHSDDIFSYKPLIPLDKKNFKILIPNNEYYSAFHYHDLVNQYLENLSVKANILSESFDCIHVQLTGGADSRLAFSSLMKYENVKTNCYGNGYSQNRLISEQLSKSLSVKRSANLPFVGTGLRNSALIIRALHDSNCQKFMNLDLYMNSDSFMHPNECQVTGFYGPNIAGSIPPPTRDTESSPKVSRIPPELFDYHDYVSLMKKRHAALRDAALADIFYLNNRGLSHYAAHSITNNKKCHSFDILYDPINIKLVQKCPYRNADIDRNAISVDLIHEISPALAMFPYDSRKIPAYRKFDNVPLVNCFDGLSFASQNLPPLGSSEPPVNVDKYDLLNKGRGPKRVADMLNYPEIDYLFDKFPCLEYVKTDTAKSSQVSGLTILYFVFSNILLNQTNTWSSWVGTASAYDA